LAEKLTLDYLKYNSPSIIIRNVKIGVDEINKKTSFKIMFDVIKSEIDKKVKIIVFKILKRI
jgi:plasmid replication initiation protein